MHVSLGFYIYCCFVVATCTTRDRWVAAEDMSSVAYAKLATVAVECEERLWVLRPKLHAAGLHIYTCMYT